MRIELNTDGLDLQSQQALRLDDAAGTRLRCLRGRVWITQEGDRRDIILEPCEEFTLDRPGRAIALALCASSVRLERHVASRAAVPTRRSVVPSWLPSFGPVLASLGVEDF